MHVEKSLPPLSLSVINILNVNYIYYSLLLSTEKEYPWGSDFQKKRMNIWQVIIDLQVYFLVIYMGIGFAGLKETFKFK